MSDFIVSHLTKTVGEKTVFSYLSFIIHSGDQIGLLGINGTGKTTLLNVLSGELGFDGDVSPFDIPSNFTITTLTQMPDFDELSTILDTVLNADLPQMRAIKHYEIILSKLTKNPNNKTIQSELIQAENEMTSLNAWNIESEVKTILSRLRLSDIASPIGTLSGGQKRRVQLAQALLNESDLLLLDEPTNHLDIDSIVWLQNYLKNSKRTVLFVTHDRYFLDAIATRIFELDNATLREYVGNYQDYLTKKAENEEKEVSANHKAKQLYKSELTWIRKSPQARATKQQARIDRFENIERSVKSNNNSSDELSVSIASQRLGKKVITFNKASFGYPNKLIFQDFDFIVQPHARIGVVGENGIGKSTLLNVISGELSLTSGNLDIGKTVNIGYFSQEIRGLDENKRIINFLEEVASASKNMNGETISIVNLLEQFLFPRSMHGVLISKLSGGEKKRLYLLKILLLQPNVLLLDEPTNDFDIATLTVLENFLSTFPGVVITVSHDRYFQDKVSNELLTFENEKITHYIGAYSDYLVAKNENGTSIKLNKPQKETVVSDNRRHSSEKIRMTYQEKQEWATIEDEISNFEERISEINNEMLKNGSDSGKLVDLQKELDVKTAELEEKYNRWEYLSEKQ